MADIRIGSFAQDQLPRLGELDRSEHIRLAWSVVDGALVSRDVDWDVPNWRADGDGEHSVAHQIQFCRSHLDRGAVALSAEAGDRMIGLALVRPEAAPQTAQLAFLHVNRDWRRTGVATRLLEACIEQAKSWGARWIYVSATPSGSAVGFYRRNGFGLAEPIADLYELEPEGIHMARLLSGPTTDAER